MKIDKHHINILSNIIILLLLVITIYNNVKFRNEIDVQNNQIMVLENKIQNYDVSVKLYDSRIESLHNIIEIKDAQIDNVTRMNITLVEQIKEMKRDHDRLTEHYVNTHDSLMIRK